MPNPQVPLYTWPHRYLVDTPDMLGFQQALVDTAHGVLEGMVAAACMSGLDVSPSGASMAVVVASGIAAGPSGYLDVLPSSVLAPIATADSTNPRRDLVVIRPNQVNGTLIANPVLPLQTIPLTILQEAVIAVITGTAASSPVYPATLAGDTIVAGIRVAPGATSIAQSDIDLEARDVSGKNTRLLSSIGKFDDRCRPYRFSNNVLGIKPSQSLNGSTPESFIYIATNQVSAFPLDGSSKFNYADTFLNFNTGAITGGDHQTGSFTPQHPSAGNCIVATIGLNTLNKLTVSYGTQGTRAQCFAGIQNAQAAGAGSVNIPSSFIIAFVILSSFNGTSITELDFFDARSVFSISPYVRGQLGGTQTNDDAIAGNFGEYGQSGIAISALTDSTPKTIVSQTLQAGDYDLAATCLFGTIGGVTGTFLKFGISTVTNSFTIPSGHGGTGDSIMFANPMPTTLTDTFVCIPMFRIKLAAPATIYVVAEAAFSAGDIAANCNLIWRRAR